MFKAIQHDAARLILFSFLLLFVELALIRWLGSNILFLSYFSNFVLLGSFLGIGVGFLHAESKHFYQWSPLILTVLLLFFSIFPAHITYSGSGLNSILILGKYKKSGLPIWLTLPIVFLFVTAVMAAIAQGTALAFRRFNPLTAYRLDIIGALAGIITFTSLSYFHATPLVWGSIVCLLFGILFFEEWKKSTSMAVMQVTVMTLLLIIVGQESFTPNNFWSPYYKISLLTFPTQSYGNAYEVRVNGIPHQRIESTALRKISEPFYFLPYEHRINKSGPDNTLIVGAGTGADTAIALAKNTKHIDAVEIDPVLYQLGVKLNPDHPYANHKVNIAINDGRVFLEQSHKHYDMILFALPDSHTLVAGQSSLRLENYLFTEEAMKSVRDHLNPSGVVALYSYYLQPWYVDRLATTLKSVFKQNPCIDALGEATDWRTVLTVSLSPTVLHCKTKWSSLTGKYIAPATDDHPFLYLQHNSIPFLYIITLSFILLISFLIAQLSRNTLSAIQSYPALFFMGMAFLLLEAKSISSFALLFGTTWIVNALVFFGILVMVYLAIEVTERFPKLSFSLLYAGLLTTLCINWLTPLHSLLNISVLPRFLAATLLIFSPVFFANLIFTTQFQHTKNSTTGFAVNMIGAMVGGTFEYITLITGYRFLLIMIGMLYTLAFITAQSTRSYSLLPEST